LFAPVQPGIPVGERALEGCLKGLPKLGLAAKFSGMAKTPRTQEAMYLDDMQLELLDKLAQKLGRTKQDLLREAINTMLYEYKMILKLPTREQ